MARTNKYTSINFNDIFEKKSNAKTSSSSTSSSSTSTHSSSSSSLHKTHGGMLVLTRPTPKPLPQLLQPQNPKPLVQTPSKPSDPAPNLHRSRSEPDSSNPISLRPLGRTGSSSLSATIPQPQEREREPLVSLKPEPFVPPHLRPGFVGKEEKFGVNGQKNQGVRSVEIGPPNGYAENGRPRSVGGYERMKRGGEYDLGDVNRPGSGSGIRPNSGSGNRPNSGSGNPPNSGGGNQPYLGSGNRPSSGGRYGSSYRSPTHH